METTYSYFTGAEPGQNQYEPDYDLSEPVSIVEARYVRNRLYPGNRYIEALPPRISEEGCINKYTHAAPVPTWEEMDEMDQEELLASVELLDKFKGLNTL